MDTTHNLTAYGHCMESYNLRILCRSAMGRQEAD